MDTLPCNQLYDRGRGIDPDSVQNNSNSSYCDCDRNSSCFNSTDFTCHRKGGIFSISGRIHQCRTISPRTMLVTLVLLVILSLNLVSGQAHIEGDAVKYLSAFQYLPKSSSEQENLIHAENIKDAVKNLQRMGNIPVTGEIDERTRTLMRKPRCGVPDPVDKLYGKNKRRRRKRYVIAPTKWDKRDLTYRIINYTPDLPVVQVRRALIDAFRVWSDVTELTFTESIHGDADIMIQFASGYHKDGYPFDGKGLILAHAFFPGKGKGGDTHFDEAERWTFNSSETGVDLFMVAAHEFGHALGLSHSNEPGALMYPWYQGYDPNFKLPYDDTRGIQTIYGSRGRLPPRPPPTPNPRIPDRSGTSGGGGGGRRPDTRDGPIDPCTSSFDAISVLRQEVFLFIGKYFWRLDSRGIIKGQPLEIHSFWYRLPKKVDHFDAVYESKKDGKIVFFFEDRYWRFDGNYPVPNQPSEGSPITDFGIPADIKKIDAVFIWGFNQRTYLVSGDMYWKLQEDQDYVEPDYPRDMSIWKNIPVPLDTAFQYWDGKTYFFKDNMVYKFYDMKMRVAKGYPKPIKDNFLGCDSQQSYMYIAESNSAEKLQKKDKNGNSASTSKLDILVFSLCSMFLSLFQSKLGS